MPITDQDTKYLERCVALAETALDAGDEPFGSLLVDDQGTVLHEARNLVGGGDATQHPESNVSSSRTIGLPAPPPLS